MFWLTATEAWLLHRAISSWLLLLPCVKAAGMSGHLDAPASFSLSLSL